MASKGLICTEIVLAFSMKFALDVAERSHLEVWTVQMGFRSNLICICKDQYYSNTCSYTFTGLLGAPETNPLLSLPHFCLSWQLSQLQIIKSINRVSPHCDQGKTDLWAAPGSTSLILLLWRTKWAFWGTGRSQGCSSMSTKTLSEFHASTTSTRIFVGSCEFCNSINCSGKKSMKTKA